MSEFGNDFRIRVNTETMRAKAETVAAIVEQFSSQFEELKKTAASTANYWIGNAGEKRRSLYEIRMKEAEEIIAYLKAYTPELLQMAGIYEINEKENYELTGSLSTDMII